MTDVERVRLMEKDHKTEGWPAVEMALLTRLADRVESLESFVRMFDPDRTNPTTAMMMAIRTVKERDDLKAKLERAKKLMRFQWILEEDFEETWKNTVEEGRT